MNYDYILALDPSGNFEEGKGTTGVCGFACEDNRIDSVKDIHASAYDTKEEYWQAHIDLIEQTLNTLPNTVVVIEDFTLDPRRALQQSHSKMETPKLLGILQLYCQQHNIPYKMQRAVEVKTRWTDHILEYKHYIVKRKQMYYLPDESRPISRHCKDAIRHAVHYATFYNGGRNGNSNN